MKRFSALILFLSLFWSNSFSQEMPVPVDIQFRLLKKILSYDRNLRTRCGDTLVIGIVYQKRFRSSLNTKEEILRVSGEQPEQNIEDVPFICTAYEINSTAEMEHLLTNNNLDIVYLTPLRGIDIEQVALLCKEKYVFTFTGVPAYVSSGIIVGIDLKIEHPQILINLSSAKATKVDFNSQLLKLSKIVH
ncbi:MAG: DUF4154 domain-containing protein [Ignavibacteriae bacterium]|nr:DUF4154 domain-containing protein [Ignavibacteriota bacterium]